ncbi:dihydroorotase [Sediminicola luteus]|uniref:Dihydroorotase n=1 Tax=Sediminicola luteus TaxID=319238 RepID=A0A2A4G5Y1_9FLAO|nr:dihydroorotase [Sediminicola luteus]PCE63843.1 dihydroorotase [Sediminicola luteus]
MDVLIKSAKIVAPNQPELHLKTRDIRIENGTIVAISEHIEPSGNIEILERDNLHVSMGWFDSGISLGEPGYEERETLQHGLQVAALSGFTQVVLNTDNQPVADNAQTISALKNSTAHYATQVHPLGTLTKAGNTGDLAELFDMKNQGAVGFYDYKRPIGNANLLKIALQYTQPFNGLVHSFALEKNLAGKGMVNEGISTTQLGLKGIPHMAEAVQVRRDLAVLEYSGGALHIPTISTAESIIAIREAKAKGLDVSCSVALHHLWLDDSVLSEFDTNYKLMPPLRTKEDQKALREALLDDTIDFVTTDHCPMDTERKLMEFDLAAYGSLGLESAFGVLNTLFGFEKAAVILAKGKSRFGLDEKEIKEGRSAELSFFDPEPTYTLQKADLKSTSKNSAFIGEALKGKVYGIYNNAQLIVE